MGRQRVRSSLGGVKERTKRKRDEAPLPGPASGKKPRTAKEDIRVILHNCNGFDDITEYDTLNLIKSQKPEIVGILETHHREEDTKMIKVPGYRTLETRRSDLAGDTEGGGIMVFMKETSGVKIGVKRFKIKNKELEYVNKERMWVTAVTGADKVAVGFVYMSHQSSTDKWGKWNDGIYEVLEGEVGKLKEQGFRVLLKGDFNGWIGCGAEGVTGNRKEINKNGERLLSFLRSSDMKHLNGTRACTGLFSRHGTKSSTLLDYVCSLERDVSIVKSVFVDEKGEFGGHSDHVYVITTLNINFHSSPSPTTKSRLATKWKLEKPVDWEKFRDILDQQLVQIPEEVKENVHGLSRGLNEALVHSMGEVVGKEEDRKRQKKLYPEGIRKELKNLLQASREWREARSRTTKDPSEGNRMTLMLKELRMKSQESKVDGIMNSFWNERRAEVVEKISEPGVKSTKLFWKYVTNKSLSPTTFTLVEDPEIGETVSSEEDIMRVVEEFLRNLFKGSYNPPLLRDVTEQDLFEVEEVPELIPDLEQGDQGQEDREQEDQEEGSQELNDKENGECKEDGLKKPFKMEEVLEAIKSLKRGKAMGVDDIPNEAILNSSIMFVSLTTQLYNLIQETGTGPEVWKTGRLVLIHKANSTSDMANYRPLTVLTAMSGLFSRVLNERLTKVVEERNLLGEIQQGFRKNRRGADNNFVLNTIIMKAAAKNKKVHIAYLDIKKAYDTVSRVELWRRMRKMGLGGIVGVLKAIYQDDRLVANVNGAKTRELYLGRGLRQGCSLCPILFALYVVDWGRALEASGEGVIIGNVKIGALFFADDVVLVSWTAEGLKRLLKLSEDETRALKLTILEKKSMVMSACNSTWDLHDEEGEVFASLDKIMSYKYLGLDTLNTMTRITTAKQKKCVTAARRYRAAARYLSRRGPDVVDLSICSWRNVAIPAITFGCEMIQFSEATFKSLDQESARWAKETLNLASNTPNVCSQILLGVPSFKEVIIKGQLKYYLRLKELPTSRYASQALWEHEYGGWPSSYLDYITDIRVELDLIALPQTTKEIDEIVSFHFLEELAVKLENLPSVMAERPQELRRARSAREGKAWNWVNMAIMGSYGIQRQMGDDGRRRRLCPVDQVPNTDLHCVTACSLNNKTRSDTNVTQFFNSCRVMGISTELAYRRFISGLTGDGESISEADYEERGGCLEEIYKACETRTGVGYTIHYF